MKIRKGNNNPKNPSLVVGIPKHMKEQMGLELGSHIMWRLNDAGRWELVKMVIE